MLGGLPRCPENRISSVDSGATTYKYDAENRIINVDNIVGYVYDADGRRVKKVVSGVGTEYLYDLSGNAVAEFRSSNGTEIRREIFAAGGLHFATYVAGETFFAYSDWEGTEKVRTDPTSTIAQACEWTAFGQFSSCSSYYSYTDPVALSSHNYAGYEHDSETGLDHTWFRSYNSVLGRWMSNDPLAGNIGDPQSLNRYAYVNNNPMGFVDPWGLNGNAPNMYWTCYGSVCTYYMVGGTIVSEFATLLSGGGGGGGFGMHHIGMLQNNGNDQGGGGGGGGGANNGTPKSPARQQCEAKAQQKYTAATGQAGSDFKKGFVAGVVGTSVINFAAGCAIGGGIGAAAGTTIAEFTGATSSFGGAAVGCFTGGVDTTLNGFVPSLVNGTLIGGGVYLWDRYSASSALKQDLQACSQIQ